jgi:hypothetical protein
MVYICFMKTHLINHFIELRRSFSFGLVSILAITICLFLGCLVQWGCSMNESSVTSVGLENVSNKEGDEVATNGEPDLSSFSREESERGKSNPSISAVNQAQISDVGRSLSPSRDMLKTIQSLGIILEPTDFKKQLFEIDASLFGNSPSRKSLKFNASGGEQVSTSLAPLIKDFGTSSSFDRRAFWFKEPTEIVLDPTRDMMAKGRQGTACRFEKFAFEFEDGTICEEEVTLFIREYYELDEILLAGLTTDSPKGLLQTGGMVHTAALSNGEPVRLRENAKASLSFSPIIDAPSDYGLYEGKIENDRIIWEKSKLTQSQSDPEWIRVAMQPAPKAEMNKSFPQEIPRGFARFLDRRNDMPRHEVISTQNGSQILEGLGEVAFPNGVRLLFHGELEIIRFEASAVPDYHRFEEGESESTPSDLEVYFAGAFICGKIPSAHPRSSLKVHIRKDEQRNDAFPKFITYSPEREPSVFLVNPKSLYQDEHSTVVTWNHILNGIKKARFAGIANDAVCLQDRHQKIHPIPLSNLTPDSKYRAKLAYNYGSFGAHELVQLSGEVGFLEKNFMPTEATSQFWDQFIDLKGLEEKTSEIESDINQLNSASINPSGVRMFFANRNMVMSLIDSGRLLPREETEYLELLRSRIIPKVKSLSPDEGKHLSELRSVLANLLTKNKELENIHQKFIKRLKRGREQTELKNDFLAIFGVTSLGWHNLDRLIKRRPNRGFELVDQTQVENEDDNSTQFVESSYYALWPSAGVSTRALIGQNQIPGGDFVALGFRLNDKMEIFADFKPSRTGEEVRLNFEKMSREEFGEKVQTFR